MEGYLRISFWGELPGDLLAGVGCPERIPPRRPRQPWRSRPCQAAGHCSACRHSWSLRGPTVLSATRVRLGITRTPRFRVRIMHSRFDAIAKYNKIIFVGRLLNFKTFGRRKIEEVIQTRGNVDEVFNCHPWKGKICFVVQCFGLLYSNSLSNFRIFLPIYSSVGCRNLSHQLIENFSQCNCFNNSSGNVSIQQLHCCMIYFLLSFDFCCTFRDHIPQLSLELFCWSRCRWKQFNWRILTHRRTVFIRQCHAHQLISIHWYFWV